MDRLEISGGPKGPRRLLWLAAVGGAGFALGALWQSGGSLAYASEQRIAAPAAPARKCVGMFAGGDRRTVAADTKGLVVVGQEKPAEDVMGWAQQGIYRVFDDGAVEFLASPVPPRPAGDTYAWIRYPNPG